MQDTGIVLLGTIRADGTPRISPCEAYIVDGDLMLGMMWRSQKALDLLRDPRLTVVTAQADRSPGFGDLKLYGRAIDVHEPSRRHALQDAQQAAIGWHPTEPYHLFALDVVSAGYISFGKDRRLIRWTAAHGVEVMRHRDDGGNGD